MPHIWASISLVPSADHFSFHESNDFKCRLYLYKHSSFCAERNSAIMIPTIFWSMIATIQKSSFFGLAASAQTGTQRKWYLPSSVPERVFTELFFPALIQTNTCFSKHLVFFPDFAWFFASPQPYSQTFVRKPSVSSSWIFFVWFLSGFRKTSKRLVFFRLFMFAMADNVKILLYSF
jgi:hypothetical protein